MKKYSKDNVKKTNRGPRIATCSNCRCKITEKDIIGESENTLITKCVKCGRPKSIRKNKLEENSK